MYRAVDRGTFYIMNVISRAATHLNEERETGSMVSPSATSFPQLRQGPRPSRSACQNPRSYSIQACQDF